MTNITETEALSKVASYCSTAEHCRAEISEKNDFAGLLSMTSIALRNGEK